VPSSSDPSPPPATGLEVRPFRALTYRRRDPEHLARVSSPAYDLVTAAGRESLAAADPHNIVRLILPRVEPPPGQERPGGGAPPTGTAAGTGGSGGPAGGTDGFADPARSAAAAAAELQRWEAEGVLERDLEPALWLYELRPAGGTAVTRGWLGAVALPTGGSRAVLPHEDTFPLAVEGRRALLDATRTDLEPIVLAHDPDEEVAALADDVATGSPDLEVTDADGVRHLLWRVGDPLLVDRVRAALQRTGAVIADGHHRFAAAQAHARQRPGAPGADAVLALVTPMGPGGLRVEAIHRVVPDLTLDRAVSAASAGFQVDPFPLPSAAWGASSEPDPALVEALDGWVHGAEGPAWLLTDGRSAAVLHRPTAEVVAAVPREAPDAWRGLDVVLAHAGLFEHLWERPDDPGSILVAHDVRQALQLARARDGVAVLLRAPSPADVAAVARAGARMPRKSTLFVPKPRTGLILRPLED
jgi:uncharacterized protein (DUF1015 family)